MKKSLLIPLLILITFFLSTSCLYGKNYYFSNSIGNDAWSGTLAAPNGSNTDGPKRSLTALNTLLNNVAQAGDSVLLKRGDLWSGATGIAASSAHGTAGSYIIIGAYGSGNKPVIDKTGIGEVLNCRGSATFESSYLKFQNLSLTTSSPSGSRPTGVNVNESFYTLKPHHITFDRLTIRGCQNGMVLYQHHLIVENCYLEQNGNNSGNGIYTNGNNFIIRNNVLDSNGTTGTFFSHTFYISQSDSVLLEGNEIRNAEDGFKIRSSNNVIVRNNLIHDMSVHAIHLGGDALSGTRNIIVEGNLVYNSPNGLEIKSESGTQTLLSENIIIKNNIFSAQVIISNSCLVKDIFIYNNLFYSGTNQNALLFFLSPNPVNVKIKNNIFYKISANANHSLMSFIAASVFNEVSFDNNLYYFPVSSGNIIRAGTTNYTTLSAFKTAYPAQEINGQQGNPNFVAAPTNFHLTASSILAIDKGADLTGAVTLDFDGKTRPSDGDGINGPAWDIGPYEYLRNLKINETNERIKIRLYPNPAEDYIEINLGLNFNMPLNSSIAVYSILGQLVLKTINPETFRIDVSELPSGIYILKMDGVVGRFVKN